jgi:hypothetical protein
MVSGMTPAGECNFRVTTSIPASELQLHQVGVVTGMKEVTPRHSAWFGQLADGHGNFITSVAPGTVNTVLQHFVAEGLTFGDAEVEALEETGDSGEETDALDAGGFSLSEEGVNEQPTGSVSLGVGMDDDGADLGEVRAVDVKSSTADELVRVCFNHGEGVDVGADFEVGASEEGAVGGEAVDQVINGAGVLQLSFTRSHGCCCEFVFRCEEGGCG